MGDQPENPERQSALCLSCCRRTSSLKRYDVPIVMFFFIAISFQTAVYTACPSCMRNRLILLSLGSILFTNLLWPAVFLFYCVLFVGTFLKGHSLSVEADLAPSVTEGLPKFPEA
jgi:hypothetical protein